MLYGLSSENWPLLSQIFDYCKSTKFLRCNFYFIGEVFLKCITVWCIDLFSNSLILSFVIFTLLLIPCSSVSFSLVFVSFVISICFKRVCYCLLKHVYVCRLKWLSHNSSIRVNLSFGVCWSSFLTHTVSLLVLGVTDDFLFYPGHFVYYVKRLQALFKSFILAWSHSV